MEGRGLIMKNQKRQQGDNRCMGTASATRVEYLIFVLAAVLGIWSFSDAVV
jgi:hypothetical protein